MIDEKPDILDRWQTTIIYGIRAIWVFAIVAAAIGLSGCTPPLPPAPNPPEPDPHPVDPTPVVDGFRVLIIEETERRRELPPDQLAILTSAPFRAWLGQQGAESRIWDQQVDTAFEDDGWRAMLAVKRTSLPWIVVTGKSGGFSGPLPATVADTEALIARYKP